MKLYGWMASVTNGGWRPVCEESMGIFLFLVMLLTCDKGTLYKYTSSYDHIEKHLQKKWLLPA